MALRLFRVGRPRIALYKDKALTTRKSAMVVMVLGAFLAKMHSVMTPMDCTTLPVKPLSSIGAGLNRLRLIHILTNAS